MTNKAYNLFNSRTYHLQLFSWKLKNRMPKFVKRRADQDDQGIEVLEYYNMLNNNFKVPLPFKKL